MSSKHVICFYCREAIEYNCPNCGNVDKIVPLRNHYGHLINNDGTIAKDPDCKECQMPYYDDPQRREQNLPLRKWTFVEATWKDKLLTWPLRAGLAVWKEVMKWTA